MRALVCGYFPHPLPPSLSHPVFPFHYCLPVTLFLSTSVTLPAFSLQICSAPPPGCCPPLSPPGCRIVELKMNERLDSMRRMMAQLNVPLRNASLCCGVFLLQLELESICGGSRLVDFGLAYRDSTLLSCPSATGPTNTCPLNNTLKQVKKYIYI